MQIKNIKFNKIKFFALVVFLGIFFVSLLLTEKFSQSFHFVDEEDHMVFGFFINQGKKLYRDLSSNHQPVVYLFSAGIQKISRPSNLFLLIKRNREGVFLYSFVWSLLLFSMFGPIFLLFSLFFELTKFFIFGNLILAESLVVYPLLFILGQIFRVLFYSYKPKKWESFVFGLANFLIVFNVLPLIPSLIILNLIYLIKVKEFKRTLVGFFIPTLVLFIFAPPFDWFRETVFYNLKYAIPAISNIKTGNDYLTLALFPVLSFFKGDSSILRSYIQLFSLILIMGTLFFTVSLRKKEKKKKIIFYLLLLTTIFLLNNRVLIPGKMYYQGFHLLPWYGAVIFFGLLTIEFIIKNNKGWQRFIPLLILIIGGAWLLLSPDMVYRTKIDKDREHNINYYPYYLTGKAIKSISTLNDKLAVFPHESLLHWQSGLNPTTRQILYYDWEYHVPRLRREMEENFNHNSPEFIYWNTKQVGPASYLPFMEPILENDYYQAIRLGVAQPLYIKKSKIRLIPDQQWQEWFKLGFDPVNIEEIK